MSRPICPLFDRILACRFGATREAFGSSKVWLDVFVYLFVLYLAVREAYKWLRIRCRYGTSFPYLSNVYNILEIVNVLPLMAAAFLRYQFHTHPDNQRFTVFAGNRYQEMGNIAEIYSLAFLMDSISILVSCLKFFKFLRLNSQALLLLQTLSRAGRDIGFFFLMLILFLLMFVVIAEQSFGSTMIEYHTLGRTGIVLVQMLLGVVDIYWDMIDTQDKMIAFLYFFIYIFVMFLVLVNIFLAILNDAYATTKEDMGEQAERKRQEAEDAAHATWAAGEDDKPPKPRGLARAKHEMQLLNQAARGRFHRFEARVKSLTRRRRTRATRGTTDWR